MNEFNEYVRDCFSEVGEIVIKSMMGGFLVYFKGKLIGDICGDELFLKRTPTSDRLLADSELRYPYDGSKNGEQRPLGNPAYGRPDGRPDIPVCPSDADVG